LCLAFQEVGAKRLGEADISAFFAGALLLLCCALALFTHWTLFWGGNPTAFLYIMLYDAHLLSRKGEAKPGLMLAGGPPLWQGPAAHRGSLKS
jgi:hypothetical protein